MRMGWEWDENGMRMGWEWDEIGMRWGLLPFRERQCEDEGREEHSGRGPTFRPGPRGGRWSCPPRPRGATPCCSPSEWPPTTPDSPPPHPALHWPPPPPGWPPSRCGAHPASAPAATPAPPTNRQSRYHHPDSGWIASTISIILRTFFLTRSSELTGSTWPSLPWIPWMLWA